MEPEAADAPFHRLHPLSPFFDAEAFSAYTAYDPEQANALLDATGLAERDYEGFRRFPDGTRMAFFLNAVAIPDQGVLEFVVDDWAAVGVRVIFRERSTTHPRGCAPSKPDDEMPR